MKLALGTAQFGLDYGIANDCGQVNIAEAGSILDCARQNGIDTLDTAVSYGDSEKILGQIGVDDWDIITKLPPVPEDVSDVESWIEAKISNSLKNLKVGSLYGLLLHQPAQIQLPRLGQKIAGTLQRLKEGGLIKKLGVSIYNPDDLEIVCERMDLDIVQAPFNVFDRRLESSGCLARLNQAGIEVHARSAFLQGLLLMTQKQRPEAFHEWQQLWSMWDQWLKDNKVNALEACLSLPLNTSGINKVVFGVVSKAQLMEVLNSTGKDVPLLPDNLQSADSSLINPALWSKP